MLNKNSGLGKSVFVFSFLCWVVLGASFTAKSQDLPMDKVNELISRTVFKFDKKSVIYKKGITQGRYMEKVVKRCTSKDVTFPNWGPEFPLKRCTYDQPDKKAPKKIKTATVIMLNPEAEVLAKWIIASCLIVKGNTGIEACANKLADSIIQVSGSQFAIAGIVLEDQRPKHKDGTQGDGIQEVYIFRDGVTVDVQGGIHWGFTGMFGEAENAVALDPTHKATVTGSTSGPARIQNTKRQMYLSYMGTQAKDVKELKWLDVVRDLYQDAWKRAHSNSPETVEKYRNDLMVAKCYSLMGIKPPKKSTKLMPHRNYYETSFRRRASRRIGKHR
jgi:hypothetical protein